MEIYSSTVYIPGICTSKNLEYVRHIPDICLTFYTIRIPDSDAQAIIALRTPSSVALMIILPVPAPYHCAVPALLQGIIVAAPAARRPPLTVTVTVPGRPRVLVHTQATGLLLVACQ